MKTSNFDRLIFLINELTSLKDGEVLGQDKVFALLYKSTKLPKKDKSSLNFCDEADAEYDIENLEEFANEPSSLLTKENLLSSIGYHLTDDEDEENHWALFEKAC